MTRLADTARYSFGEMIRPLSLIGFSATGVGGLVAHSAGLPLGVKVGFAALALCGVANAVYRGYREASITNLIMASGGGIAGYPDAGNEEELRDQFRSVKANLRGSSRDLG